MEVVVQSLQGIDTGSIISIRAGSTRRQGPTPLEKPFRFPNLPLNVGSLKVDVLRPVGSCRVSVAPEAEEEYSVLFPAVDGMDTMKMELLVREMPTVTGVSHGEPAEVHGGMDDPDRRAAAEDSARAYIERWRLMDFIREMLQYIIREKPQDPYAFMSTYMRRRTKKERESPAGRDLPTVTEADLNQDSLRATIARQNARLDAENDRLRDEIEKLRQFCEEKGLPPVDEPLDLTISEAALVANQDLTGRNSQLRIEHQELRRTLDTFCRGFAELASRLNAVVATPLPTQAPLPHAATTQGPQYEEVMDAEMEVEAANARIEKENQELTRQIRELTALGDGSTLTERRAST